MDSTQQGNAQEATQETATKKTMFNWAKLKTLYTTIKTSVVAFFTTTAEKLKALWNSRPWVKYAVVAVAIIAIAGGIGYWRDRQLVRQIYTLQTEAQVKAEQIKVVEAEKNDLLTQIAELKKQLTATQVKNDSKIKEAGKHAYQKANSIPDSAVLRNFNLLIDGARKRNANR